MLFGRRAEDNDNDKRTFILLKKEKCDKELYIVYANMSSKEKCLQECFKCFY